MASANAGVEAVVELGGQAFTVKIPQTGHWEKFQGCPAGTVEIKASGVQTLKLRPADAAQWKAANIRSIRLTKTQRTP